MKSQRRRLCSSAIVTTLLALCSPSPVDAQQPLLTNGRVSTALFRDSRTQQLSFHSRLQWTQPALFGSLTGLVETTRTPKEFRNGRTGFEWRSTTAFAKAGAFVLEPLRFTSRSGNVGLPAVPLRGFQTGLVRGPTALSVFTGSLIVDEGARSWTTRKTADHITGISVSRTVTKSLAVAIEADRTTSLTSTQSHVRPSFRWTIAKGTAVIGEYSTANGGRSSFHAGIERDNSRVGFNAAFVKRSRQYLSWGPWVSYANREGVSADTRLYLTRGLELSVGGSDFRSQEDRRSGQVSQRLYQYSATASIKLSTATQVIVNRQSSGASQRTWSWRNIVDSATFAHTSPKLSTRVRVDRVAAGPSSRTWGVEVEESRAFFRTAISGRVRWQSTHDVSNAAGRFSAGISASRNVGKWLTVAVQTELAGEKQIRSLAKWHQRNVAASAGVRLSPSAKVNLELYRTSFAVWSAPLSPRAFSAGRTVFIEFEKAFP